MWEVCIFTGLRSYWKFRPCAGAERHFWQLWWSYTLFLQEPPLKQPIFPVHLWYGFTISAVVSKISPLLHLISFMLLRASTFLCDQTRWSLQLILHVFSWFLLAGKLVEEEEGSFAVWLSYLVTGVGANVVSWLVLPRSVVSAGASGAVFGLFAVSVLVKVCHSTH
jgi:membrane associated rhomboid family serine protease